MRETPEHHESIRVLLGEHPFTHDLPESVRERLRTIATLRVYDPDTLVIRQGRAASHFFLIVDGLVAIELYTQHLRGRDVIRIQTLGGGDVIGWSWLIPPYRWAFDARVIAPSQMIVLDADRLRAWMETDPAFGFAVLRKLVVVIAERLQATRLQLLDIHTAPSDMVPRELAR